MFDCAEFETFLTVLTFCLQYQSEQVGDWEMVYSLDHTTFGLWPRNPDTTFYTKFLFENNRFWHKVNKFLSFETGQKITW